MTDIAIQDPPAPKAPAPAPPRPSLRHVDRIEQKRAVWAIKLPGGSTDEDLLNEGFWRHVARHLTRHDTVFALAEDESWEAELRIEGVSPDGCEVTVVRKMRRKAVVRRQTALGDGAYHSEYKDGSWCVIRNKDGFAVVAGEATESSAIMKWAAGQPRQGR